MTREHKDGFFASDVYQARFYALWEAFAACSADYSKFDMGKVYMFILLAILPVLVVYIILSKSIIKGVTAGSVKG